MAEIRRPVDGNFSHLAPLFHHAFAFIERVAVAVDHRLHFVSTELTGFDQLVSIQLTRCRVFFDFLVHQRLRRIRLVRFVVTITAVTYQVNDHIAFKGVAVIYGQLGNKHHRFRIITVNVENWCLHHFSDIGTVFRRTGIFRV